MKNIVVISALVATFFSTASSAQVKALHVVSTLHIQSAGRWDYIAINPLTGNLYVSHATQVNILSPKGDSVGVINNTTGVHGIAFAPAFSKGFISNGKLNTVTVFDIKTNLEIARINTGENPDAIMYDNYSKKIYVCNGKSKDLSIIEPANNTVIATVALGGKPETAVSDEKGNIFINIEDKNEIVKLNAATFAVEAHWPLIKGESPSGLAIDVKTMRLFAGCDNKALVILNAENGKLVGSMPIGDGCDGVGFDTHLKHIYSSNGEGTLTVIKELSADKYQVLENVKTKKGARTLVVDEKSHRIYLPTAEFAPLKDKSSAHARPDMIPGTFMVLVVAGE